MAGVIVLLIFIVLGIIYLKNNPIKKGKDIFSIYNNSFSYRLIAIIFFILLAIIIFIFQKAQ